MVLARNVSRLWFSVTLFAFFVEVDWDELSAFVFGWRLPARTVSSKLWLELTHVPLTHSSLRFELGQNKHFLAILYTLCHGASFWIMSSLLSSTNVRRSFTRTKLAELLKLIDWDLQIWISAHDGIFCSYILVVFLSWTSHEWRFKISAFKLAISWDTMHLRYNLFHVDSRYNWLCVILVAIIDATLCAVAKLFFLSHVSVQTCTLRWFTSL